MAVALVCAGAALGHQIAVYAGYLADDALISLRFAERLLEGRGLTWNDGDFVEGYTNLLWVVAAAAIGATGVDLVTAVRCLGGVCLIATIGSLAVLDARLSPGGRPTIGTAVAALFLAATPAFPVWTVGGLETLLVAAALAVAMARLVPLVAADTEMRFRDLAVASAALAAGTLARADFPVLVIAVTLSWVVFDTSSLRRRLVDLLILAGPSAVVFLTQMLFRIFYYDDFVPNTARAKVAFTDHRTSEGLAYLADGLGTLLWPATAVVLIAIATAAAVAKRTAPTDAARPSRHVRFAAFVSSIAATWIVYTLVVGGDFFPGYRFLVPVYVAFAALLVIAMASVPVKAGAIRGLSVVGLAGAISAHGLSAAGLPLNALARHEDWVWTCRAFAEELKSRFADHHPTMAVTAAGCLPFYTGFPSIDMFGLVDRELARRRPPEFGNGAIGHELLDVDYVVRRHPDFVVMHIGDHPHLINAFKATPEFLAEYAPMAVPVRSLDRTFWIWANRDFRSRYGG